MSLDASMRQCEKDGSRDVCDIPGCPESIGGPSIQALKLQLVKFMFKWSPLLSVDGDVNLYLLFLQSFTTDDEVAAF